MSDGDATPPASDVVITVFGTPITSEEIRAGAESFEGAADGSAKPQERRRSAAFLLIESRAYKHLVRKHNVTLDDSALEREALLHMKHLAVEVSRQDLVALWRADRAVLECLLQYHQLTLADYDALAACIVSRVDPDALNLRLERGASNLGELLADREKRAEWFDERLSVFSSAEQVKQQLDYISSFPAATYPFQEQTTELLRFRKVIEAEYGSDVFTAVIAVEGLTGTDEISDEMLHEWDKRRNEADDLLRKFVCRSIEAGEIEFKDDELRDLVFWMCK